ncbi:His Kinase A (phospho-acceptor) domain-containing protein [Desulfocicer vacuolatum DSM 3385]|uniref:histidine kinase n=1 Tax=Desulfocicer vacuolatum DSM 3385 TaxID=1121400 RepID=A0A1W2CAC4_9BACT|nr:response regulator [Desulfocicer vacuolatum]SMC82081.1 His Kinase A (phospho-acceptor) domain-containing protein [Desulfocicer vacuolatum DSM 3385]
MSKILAIDDKPDNLISISALLKIMLSNCEVITATSGPEGIFKAETLLPDTILLDIKMPDMDGYEVCRQLKKNDRTKHIPIIMISAIRTDSKDLAKGLETGADAYLAKPIDEYVLTAQVKTALRVKAAEDILRSQKQDLEKIVQERTAELLQSNRQLRKEISEHQREKEKNKALESQLRQSQKMEAIGTLAGGIAHDFNNILFPIFGYTQMLLEDAPLQGDLRHGLNQIMAGAERARDLVQQILTVSRQQEQTTRPLKPHLVIKEVLNLMHASLPSTIKICQDINTSCGMIMADPTQVHQITMNLITNAFQAMGETGGELFVTLKPIKLTDNELNIPSMAPGEYICLTVKDSGPGMDKSMQERIFDPYFTTKKKGRGTGLGLSIVNGIVQSHGGYIELFSRPGQGAEFKIYLPTIKDPAGNCEKKKLKLQRGNEQILLVDDQESTINVEKQMLEHLGYAISAYTDPGEALKHFSEHPEAFDLVITDLTMPDMTGDKLAVELMKIQKDIRVILNTGFSESMTREKAKKLGIKALLMKPVSMETLASSLRSVLDNK